jgi:hypothetical protein
MPVASTTATRNSARPPPRSGFVQRARQAGGLQGPLGVDLADKEGNVVMQSTTNFTTTVSSRT